MLRAQNVSEQNQKHFLCPGHKICVRNKCCARGQTGKRLCRQQCVLVCQGLKNKSKPIVICNTRVFPLFYRLHVFPRSERVTCFLALGAGCMLSLLFSHTVTTKRLVFRFHSVKGGLLSTSLIQHLRARYEPRWRTCFHS